MLGHDLDAVVLRRVVALKRFSLFEGVDLPELATLAQNVVDTTFVPGQRVADTPESMHFIVEGAFARSDGFDFDSGHIVGGLELLAGRPARAQVRATRPTRTLCLSAEDLFELLDDNFGLLLAALRTVAMLSLGTPRPPVEAAHIAIPASLGLVERLLLLRRQTPLARARIRALTTLAHGSQELTWPSGTVIVHASELAATSYVIVEGNVRVGNNAAALLGPGQGFGLLETLAACEHRAAFEAVTPVRALASTGGVLHDVLEDHSDLGLAVLASLAGDVLDLRPRDVRERSAGRLQA